MKLTVLTSAAALMLAFSAPAMAAHHEMTIGGAMVSESDMPYVEARCAELKVAEMGAPSGDKDPGEGENEENDDAAEGANALTTIDLDTLTYEQCEEGGFYKDAM